MARTIYAHVPFPQVLQHLEYMIAKGVHPEIFFSGDTLDSTLPEEVESVAAVLAELKLSCTIHAPFMDLNPLSLHDALPICGPDPEAKVNGFPSGL